ncbi:hypothetical protein OAG29_02210, partial [Planctomycetaceae bacterium]|nr:hypothetical protein [Planctomycetaceae bacterium]
MGVECSGIKDGPGSSTPLRQDSIVNLLQAAPYLFEQSIQPAWFALAFYVSLYVPVFVFCTRTAVYRWKVPLTLAAPVVWVGLEFFRAHLLTGFSWYYLGHTQ